MRSSPSLRQLALAVHASGGCVYFVGGCVRDQLLGIKPQDIDLEVFGLTAQQLQPLLETYGVTIPVKGSFPVFKWYPGEGVEYDVALPRRERKHGTGHTGFLIEADPDMTPAEAAQRRDFTINALLQNVLTGQIVDTVGGLVDLQNRLLRPVSSAFQEDPLRPLRAFSFIGRFNLSPATELIEYSLSLADEYASLPVERVGKEWRKWAVQSLHPAQALVYLLGSQWIQFYPELKALLTLQQDPVYHPEGTVFQHTLHVVDAAARIARRDGLDEEQTYVLLIAALCHDLGKATTTSISPSGRIISPGHEEAGVEVAKHFLSRIGFPLSLTPRVLTLVREHMAHLGTEQPTTRMVRRLVNRLAVGGTSLPELARLVEADLSGRPPLPIGLPDSFKRVLWVAETLPLAPDGTIPPLVTGKDLLGRGYAPGPAMGKLLRYLYERQINGDFATKESGLNLLDTYVQP
jgi:tRNA nucleotidyltransferase (CCA-adding enzyme)